MRAFAQFMLSIGSMGSLETSALTQILLLGSNDDNEDFEPEAFDWGQMLQLPRHGETLDQILQNLEISTETWTVAAELENADGSFTYQLVHF